MTKLLICGSRDASPALVKTARNAVIRARDNEWSVIVGDAAGVDYAVALACDDYDIEFTMYGITTEPRSGWPQGRHFCGYHQIDGNYLTRDRAMAEAADACFAIWNGISRGTIYTYNYAVKLGKQAWLRTLKP